MVDDIITQIRRSSETMQNAILRRVTLEKSERIVTVQIVTDKAFTEEDREGVLRVIRNYVPRYFTGRVEISKLSPDCDMVKKKIEELIDANFKTISVTLTDEDIRVTKTENGFEYTIAVMPAFSSNAAVCEKISRLLKENFCGDFFGKCVSNGRNADDIEVEEKEDEPEFAIPVRTFEISDFSFLEGEKIQKKAVYMSDLNLAGDEVVVCGTIEDLRVRTYTNKRGLERTYLSLSLTDTTAVMYTTYFPRQKSIDKINALKIGDSIVCTGKNEVYNGNLRFTATTIDYGKVPAGFVPEKRVSKPVPKAYHFVKPQPFIDMEQSDMFSQVGIPDCLKRNSFVVFDLETTGLNSSAVSGNMDAILEIGAYKIVDGEIKESFSTFVNPARRLSEEITALTGITEEMVADAPACDDVMPDFFKFCDGSILVGHNIAGFDFKFVDHYCAKIGYILERKLIDTIPLSQELLVGLSNYKLNTVAARFNITFNHHRAMDDALATAKIFIELIKLKKSLPKLQ